MPDLPRTSTASRISSAGEGAFQSLLSTYAILHKVSPSDDIGIDYFCEWLYKATERSLESTNVLFAVQLKTSEKSNVEVVSQGFDQNHNLLEKFKLNRNKGSDYDNIKPSTFAYWKGFEIPVYLFVVLLSEAGNELYYKRFTPILHDKVERGSENFYKVNEGTDFLAFSPSTLVGGFCRDLFIDYIRCNYKKGSIAYKNPKSMGLGQFPEDPQTLFVDMLGQDYRDEIRNTYFQLEKLGFFDESENGDIEATTTSSASPSTLLYD